MDVNHQEAIGKAQNYEENLAKNAKLWFSSAETFKNRGFSHFFENYTLLHALNWGFLTYILLSGIYTLV